MNKPRVVFAYTEAGLGHTMPMNSIADKFEELYGDRVECVRSQFFTESEHKKLIEFEEKLKNNVVKSNNSTAYGFWLTLNMEFWGEKIGSWATMTCLVPGARKPAIEHVEELRPDMVVCTHWAPNYFAKKSNANPLTVMYCPDVVVNPLFRYPCDLALVSNEAGYNRARKHHPVRFNDENFKQVPFLIREEAFSVSTDKQEMRKKLGIPDRLTVLLAEGGYGIGKMEEICNIVIERDLPVTLLAVCGKNKELFERFGQLKSKGKCCFRPMGLVNNFFELLVASDVFCGKSGANVAGEACFFGVPHIITKYATTIEKNIGKYYIENVGSAMKIFKPEKVADKLEEILRDPALLQPYILAAKKQRAQYGATRCAEYIFNLLCTRFPELKEESADRASS